MGVWSTSSTRSTDSKPSTPSQPVHWIFSPASSASRPALVLRFCTATCTLASNTSRAKVDLPEPLTPVMATKRLSGTWAVTFCRLCRLAPLTVSQSIFGFGPLAFAVPAAGSPRAGSSYICCATAKSSPALGLPAAATDIWAVRRSTKAAYSAATLVRSASSRFAASLAFTCAAATAALAAFALSFFAGLPVPAVEVDVPGDDFVYPYEEPGTSASAASSTKVSAWLTMPLRTARGCFIACNR